MLGAERASAGTQAVARAGACVVCGGPLTGKQTRYCSDECAKTEKRRRTRASRPAPDHVCRCGTCGKEMRRGRPRLDDTNPARDFVRAQDAPELQTTSARALSAHSGSAPTV